MPVCIVMWGCAFRLFFYESANERLEQIYTFILQSRWLETCATWFHPFPWNITKCLLWTCIGYSHAMKCICIFFLLTCTLNDTVSSSATSALFCFLFWRGTGGHQDSPPKLVPQLSCFYDYSSFNNNPSISKKKKENQRRLVCFISVVECTQGAAASGCETNNY